MSKVTSLQTYDEPIRVNKRIYKISNEYIVKLISSKSLLAKEDIFYEIKIARISHSMGIPVAEPIICDYVKIYGKIQMGFIMEYVAGIEGSNEEYNKFKHPDTDLQLSNQLYEVERTKAFNLGILIVEPQWILTNDKKIKFIDVAKWQYRGLEYPFKKISENFKDYTEI